MNKSELDKSIYDREQFQKKVNDSIEVCESEKNNLTNLIKKSEQERYDSNIRLNECQNKLKDNNYMLDQEKNNNHQLNNNISSIRSQLQNSDDLKAQLLDVKHILDAEKQR